MSNKLNHSYSITETNNFLTKIEVSKVTVYGGLNAAAIDVINENISSLYPTNADRNIVISEVRAIVFFEQIPVLIAELEKIYTASIAESLDYLAATKPDSGV